MLHYRIFKYSFMSFKMHENVSVSDLFDTPLRCESNTNAFCPSTVEKRFVSWIPNVSGIGC